jgi:hypothetical protein
VRELCSDRGNRRCRRHDNSFQMHESDQPIRFYRFDQYVARGTLSARQADTLREGIYSRQSWATPRGCGGECRRSLRHRTVFGSRDRAPKAGVMVPSDDGKPPALHPAFITMNFSRRRD